MSESDLHATTLPDGRVVYTRPEREGPASLDLPAPGALGAVLAPLYRVRFVVERVDGGALTDEDRAHLHDALEAAARHDATTSAADAIRGEMFNRRCERSDAEEAVTHEARTQSARSAA
ncbi:MAG: hypothetical protein U0324_30010 [Polyangiales bacterium]